MNPEENGPANGSEDQPVLLVVDDEPEIRELFELWLGDRYTVRTAANGEKALEEVDDNVDVVLLDRRMPGPSGDQVLDEIRAANADCRVAMVTAVDPDFDIVEMGFDDYVTKPVSADELHATIESLLKRSTYDDQIQQYYSLASKKALLEAEKSPGALEKSESYEQLERELKELRTQVDDTLAGIGDNEFDALYQDFATGE